MGAPQFTLLPPHLDASPPPGSVPALQADSFNESFGVNTHANFGSGSEIPSYNNGGSTAWRNAWIDEVIAMGCRYVRDLLPTSTNLSNQVNYAYQRFAAAGIQVQGHSGATRTSGTTLTSARNLINNYLDAVQALGGAGGGVFTAFEGINEPNNDGADTSVWVNQTRNLTQALWEESKKRTTTSKRTDIIPIVGPGLARRIGGTFPDLTAADYAALGNLQAWVDYGNVHIYPAGKEPTRDLQAFLEMARATPYPTTPLMCTEGGYFDAMSYTGGSDPTPEDVNAAYVIRAVLEHMVVGNLAYFDYQWLDGPNVANNSREDNFGFIECPTTDPSTWRRKQKWYAMKRMLSLMADPGPTFTPSGLSYTLTTSATAFKSLAFQKRDGRGYIVLWRDLKLFTQHKTGGSFDGGTYTNPAAAAVNIVFDSPQTVKLHKPTSQGTALVSVPYQVLASAQSISVPVAGEVVVVELV